MDINFENAKILIVDDYPHNVDLLVELLTINGFNNTLTASDGNETIRLVEKEKPDLLLLDVFMPGINGFDICKELKQNRDLGYFLPILLITSANDSPSKQQGLLSGAEDYIGKPFDSEELLARIKVALRTKQLYDQLQNAYAKIDFERDLIAEIQKSLLPKNTPEIPDVAITTYYQPSAKAGGDYYDFMELDDNKIAIIIADVSGHGSHAAVIVGMLKIAVKMLTRQKDLSPSQVLSELQKILKESIQTDDYISMFYGILDKKNFTLAYSSAGHIPPLMYEPESRGVIELTSGKGYPLCILPENSFDEKIVEIKKDSSILFLTDGIIESMNSSGKIFGMERLKKVYKTLCLEKDKNKIEAILKSVEEYKSNSDLSDDYTLVNLDYQ